MGNGYKFPDMHLPKNLPSNIQRYGAPLNFDCTNREHALQQFSKYLSKTVAKNTSPNKFNKKLATQLQEYQVQL